MTFDDDTRSHVDHALPLLDAAGIVAGFYVGGWTLAGRRRPWWETLQLAVDARASELRELPLPHEALAGALARRPRAIRELGAAVERLGPDERERLAEALDDLTRYDARDPGLDGDAIVALARRHEVGFHTLAHDRLTDLDDTRLRAALAAGRAELEAVVGRPLSQVAYPHGAADERVAAFAADAGYTVGLAGGNRAVVGPTAPLLLPRLDPTHDSLTAFAFTLARAASARAGSGGGILTR